MKTTQSEAAHSPHVPFPPGRPCVFLDFDGTLVDFAPTPMQVRTGGALVQLLQRLAEALEGALAIISGRPIAELDVLLAPLRLPVAGLHGLERRTAEHVMHLPPAAAAWLNDLRAPLLRHVVEHEGLLLEDKGTSLAVHFRCAPQHETTTRDLLRAWSESLPEEAMLLEGDAVLEIRPSAQNKGTAVEAFLREAAFVGRWPLYIGDDYTDGLGHDAVARHGGTTIAVGNRLPAPFRLSGPAEVRAWLAALIAELATR